MRKLAVTFLMALAGFSAMAQSDILTEKKYLSGHGCDDMVPWEFFCTGGNRSGKWTKIGVPSCWELQGFGTYQYGIGFYGKPHPEGIADEKGLYQYDFTLPDGWRGRQIELVFEGAMTDLTATVNGRKVGTHQGGFYTFSFDVTELVKFGSKTNRLEVEVAKESANDQVNLAERRADYWNFGGIFRPVYVVSKPPQNISRVAIDAGMDGRFRADCYLNRAVPGSRVLVTVLDDHGRKLPVTVDAHAGHVQDGGVVTDVRSSDLAHVDLQVDRPRLWTAETPTLHTAVFTLLDANGKALHRIYQKFGFRTIEYRLHDGVYINGHRVIFKGVCRHSFWPESGRTLSKAKNIEDVKLIKGMNMNAVRLSHYPADPDFMNACDSLGLYVECELSGWHFAHSTAVGQKLVREMVTRDVNHPSIIFWSNGNEGGFNDELEPEFKRWDIQQRVVIYPWADRNGFNTKHYPSWGTLQRNMRSSSITLPTEFLHGLYDGGHAAGLADYWRIMMASPRCAGGFLWDFADQGVVRTDKNNIVDCMGNYGADGILGPHHEKEGSYDAIREIWSPVELVRAHGRYVVRNHYDFLNLNTVTFKYQYMDLPEPGNTVVRTVREGTLKGPDAAPGDSALLHLPAAEGADALAVTAIDSHGSEVFTWSFPVRSVASGSLGKVVQSAVVEDEQSMTVTSCGRSYVFSKHDGRLCAVSVGGRTISLSGPRFFASRRADRSLDQYYNHSDKEVEQKKTQYVLYEDEGQLARLVSTTDREGRTSVLARYQYGCLDSVRWIFHADGNVEMHYAYNFGGVVDEMGLIFDYPENLVEGKSWVDNGPYRVWQNRRQGPQYGYWTNAYNDPIPGESWTYPEFKGYFDRVTWMQIQSKEGRLLIDNSCGEVNYIGVFTPRDGRDHILYDLPETGIALMKVIPPIRNKVNATDLNGPSAQPFWSYNDVEHTGKVTLKFE